MLAADRVDALEAHAIEAKQSCRAGDPQIAVAGLRQRFALAIFTGRLQYEAEITLKRFAPDCPFDPLLCAEHVTKSKPAPDGLLAIQRLNPGRKLWYVGDTVDDARSARAAGVPFIGIAAQNHPRRDEILRLFREEQAVAVLENVNEIEGAL